MSDAARIMRPRDASFGLWSAATQPFVTSSCHATQAALTSRAARRLLRLAQSIDSPRPSTSRLGRYAQGERGSQMPLILSVGREEAGVEGHPVPRQLFTQIQEEAQTSVSSRAGREFAVKDSVVACRGQIESSSLGLAARYLRLTRLVASATGLAPARRPARPSRRDPASASPVTDH